MIARIRAMDPYRADALLAAVLGVEFQIEVLLLDADGGELAIAHVALVVLALGLALRRRLPLVGLGLALAAFVAVASTSAQVDNGLYLPFFCVMFAAYSAGANLSGRSLTAAALMIVLGIGAGNLTDGTSDPTDWGFGIVILGGGPLLVGSLLRSRAGLNRALREKAERLERERLRQGEQATLQERGRIAGELHDVVAHALSAMVVQAAGARRLIAADPRGAEAAFAAVEATGREALDDLRRLLGSCAARMPSLRWRRSPASPTSATSRGARGRPAFPWTCASSARRGRWPPASTSRRTASSRRRSPRPASAGTRDAPRSSCASPTRRSRSRSATTASRRPPPAARAACWACASACRCSAAS